MRGFRLASIEMTGFEGQDSDRLSKRDTRNAWIICQKKRWIGQSSENQRTNLRKISKKSKTNIEQISDISPQNKFEQNSEKSQKTNWKNDE